MKITTSYKHANDGDEPYVFEEGEKEEGRG